MRLDPAAAWVLGVITPFAIIFTVAAGLSLARKVKRAIVYARPAHLERRLNVAGRFAGARRAYHLGTHHLTVALIVGRQYGTEEQAIAVLKDEFLPLPEPGISQQ